jgi:hypothetical protein
MTIIVSTIASASARTYTWLLASVGTWNGNRSDLAALIPDFVMLAEKRLNADLEARLQDSVVMLTPTIGVNTVAIPSDVSDMKSLSIAKFGALEYITPDLFSKLFSDSVVGTPRMYTIIGEAIYLGPTPDSTTGIACAYRAFLPPLADSAGTNWLIEKYPNCYLAATMIESIAYTKNVGDLPMWEKKYADAIASVNGPDWFNGSNMRVRSDVQL